MLSEMSVQIVKQSTFYINELQPTSRLTVYQPNISIPASSIPVIKKNLRHLKKTQVKPEHV